MKKVCGMEPVIVYGQVVVFIPFLNAEDVAKDKGKRSSAARCARVIASALVSLEFQITFQ